MKVFIEEYGSFIVAVVIGLALLGILTLGTIKNTSLLQRATPNEREMNMGFLSNKDVMDTKKIPQMDIVDCVAVMINPENNNQGLDFMKDTIVRSVTDGEGHKVTRANYVPMAYARNADKLRKGYINIIGYDAVNTQVKGDYKVTYQYENPNTGYKNIHTLVVMVRRPYIPFEYLQSTSVQQIDTGINPWLGTTVITVTYQPTTTAGRQDIVWCNGVRAKYGIFIKDGKWWYAYDSKEVNSGISASTAKVEVTLDGVSGKFIVGSQSVNIQKTLGPDGKEVIRDGGGYLTVFKSGQTSGKLYSVQIYEGDTVRKNMFPAYQKTTNTFGLWDTVDWRAMSNTSGVDHPPFQHGREIDE